MSLYAPALCLAVACGGGANDPAGGAGSETGASDGGVGDGSTTGAPPPGTPLDERLGVTDLTVPVGVAGGGGNWRIWGQAHMNVAPVFTVPLADCGTLVCYTGDDGGARVVRLDGGDNVVETLEVGPGLQCRGLAAEPDGHFGALLWDEPGAAIRIDRFAPDGTISWSTPLVNPDNSPTDFGIGDSRMAFGNDRYGAYYHVHSDDGHEGDTLKFAHIEGGSEFTSWAWGCSHSMSNILRFNQDVGEFLPACATDCYPGTSGDFATNSIGGFYYNHRAKIMDVDAACNGRVAGELGSGAPIPEGWALVFNAHTEPATLGADSYDYLTMDQDVGFTVIGSDFTPGPVVWLTDTTGVHETDPSIAPLGDGDDLVVGWAEVAELNREPTVYWLARVGPDGALREGPIDVTGTVQWGRRDDPFRKAANGDVMWSWFDEPGSTTLHVARLAAGGSCG